MSLDDIADCYAGRRHYVYGGGVAVVAGHKGVAHSAVAVGFV